MGKFLLAKVLVKKDWEVCNLKKENKTSVISGLFFFSLSNRRLDIWDKQNSKVCSKTNTLAQKSWELAFCRKITLVKLPFLNFLLWIVSLWSNVRHASNDLRNKNKNCYWRNSWIQHNSKENYFNWWGNRVWILGAKGNPQGVGCHGRAEKSTELKLWCFCSVECGFESLSWHLCPWARHLTLITSLHPGLNWCLWGQRWFLWLV